MSLHGNAANSMGYLQHSRLSQGSSSSKFDLTNLNRGKCISQKINREKNKKISIYTYSNKHKLASSQLSSNMSNKDKNTDASTRLMSKIHNSNQSNSEAFGDQLHCEKQANTVRIGFQNVNLIPLKKNK